MPIFEYLCDDCGTKFEKLVRGGPSGSVLCPSCGQDHLQQQFSTFAAPASNAVQDTPVGGCGPGMCRMPEICGRN